MKKIKWNNILFLISIIFIIWFIVSFIDMNIHNDICNVNYNNFAKWNLFLLLE